ncbi:hypothetical protein ACNKHU_07850 [Shigella flexneri]
MVAFTLVNLSVFNHFWRRKGMNKSWRKHFHYLLMPLVGALTVGVLWINLEPPRSHAWVWYGIVMLLFVVIVSAAIAKCRCTKVTERQ